MHKPIVLLLLAFVIHAGAASADNRIRVCYHENEPLIFSDVDGRAKGIAVDILASITDDMHWDIDYIPGTYAQCIQRLESGTVDLLPGIAVTPELEKVFAFGEESLATDWGQLYIPADAPFTDILDYDRKSVAVVKADVYYRYFKEILQKFDIHPQYIEIDDYTSVLKLIQEKEVAAGIVPHLYGMHHQNAFQVNRSPISFRPTELLFAAMPARRIGLIATLDRHLGELKRHPNSVYYQSRDLWLQGLRKVTLPLWLRPLWIIGFAAGVMGLIIAGNIFLRKQVKARTEALKTTIAEKEKIESELAVAREIQLQLVPERSPVSSNRKEFDLCARLEPAREVGGDFYDYFFIDRDSLCLVIGDVSGKGVPAALFMAMTKTMIKSAARLLVEPEYILADVNREIARNNPSMTFVTVFLGVLNLNTGALTYTCAGHNPPLFIGRRGNSVLLGDAQCPAIGLDDTFKYRQVSVTLHHRESLLLFTDGVTEAQDSKNRLFTQESLMNTVSLTAGLTPAERIAAIVSRIREFCGDRPLDDDMTMLALTYFSPDRISDTLKTIVLKNDIREMNRIVAAVTDVTDTISCPPIVVHDVTLAIEEIFSNIVFYGFGDDMDHTVTLHVVVEGDTLVLTLQDEGIPFNPLNVHLEPRDKPLEERDKGGMGIILAKKLMDRMTYRRERGKNILRMEKRYQ